MPNAALREQLPAPRFLDGVTDTAIHQLARLVTPTTFAGNDLLFRQGEPRRLMALIVSGAVAIEKELSGRQVRLVTLGVGEAVGEGLLLDDTAHGTSARALQQTEVLVLSGETVATLVRENPVLYAALVGRAARSISQRLAATDATIVGRGRVLGFGGARTRMEKDLLGEREVPDDALYGVQTLRAMENFPITGTVLREFPSLIDALAAVKAASTLANRELGLLDSETADAIVRAADEIREGRHHEQFLVDMVQGGAGTSTNMNANEVIANRALELLGDRRGNYSRVHPNEHVNLSQSTNDVYPTAVRLALYGQIERLRVSMGELVASLLRKGDEFSPHLKMGRTQLQDAVPMTLGQEFAAFGHTVQEDIDRLGEALSLLREINMGATAIGTGIAAPGGFAEVVRRHLAELTGIDLVTSPDLIEATSDTGAFVQLSGVLKRCAVKISKICNDLRLLSSGPRAGLGEINLPAMQPGSSIMPGKVNPVIPEVVNQICFDIIGGDMTVTMAAEAGQFQLNAFEPIIVFRLLRSIESLMRGCDVLRTRCIEGITANPDRMRRLVETSIGVLTALVPRLGYSVCTGIAREALESGKGVYEIVLDRGLLTRAEMDMLLNPATMAGVPSRSGEA
ncbi:MAG: Fumarate hydratase class II [Gemmatimonadaceae bacterium]|nr:Fumarate hydratase class II [Gemmatimonadaceae bacterium]